MFKGKKFFLFLFILVFCLMPFKFLRADIAENLSGYILLQVEDHGEAWYVYPEDLKRYYLGTAEDAYEIMRAKGLGIAHQELQRYLNSYFPLRLSGMILLDVESHGEAYYVYPGDLQGYYLGRAADAYEIMRNLGLGITNKNLSYINSDAPWSVWEAEEISNDKIVDTGQEKCYSSLGEINCREQEEAFGGQDAQYQGQVANYTDNEDGTITDNNTGLMWRKDYDSKTDYYTALNNVENSEYSYYDDWRVPTIKELYSLIDFSGKEIASHGINESNPFINTNFFDFEYGDEAKGERLIDSQWISSNIYTSSLMDGQECFFGVNFADGRIKCYPTNKAVNNDYFVRYVRGGSYGYNSFVDKGNGTILDKSSGLTWVQSDNGEGVDWQAALAYCENLDLGGYTDWRLPNIKELQSLVDYNRSPDKSDSPAINPSFGVSEIINEAGGKDYPYYWSSTTHNSTSGYSEAAYIAFGRALGYRAELGGWIDVHGAGAQRSDPKSGDPANYPEGKGPQGDAVRIYNYVRCVRGESNFLNLEPVLQAEEEIFEEVVSNSEEREIPTEIPEPPKEAVIACYGSQLKQACGFNGPSGLVEGNCVLLSDELACVSN